MDESFLTWSCNQRKFMKIISSTDHYKERIGSKLNSTFYIMIRIQRQYDDKARFAYPPDNSYYTKWDIYFQKEYGLNQNNINAKLVFNAKVLKDKDLYFYQIGSKPLFESPFCEAVKITGYNLACVLRFPKTNVTENIIEEQLLVSKLKYLADDFQYMLDRGHLTDVTLQCGTDVLKAHKFVLSARSPVFEAMFASPMKENKDDRVIVEDIDPGIFRNAINFLYSGQVKITSMETACDLLYAGEKYQIKELIKGCFEYLKSVLSHENAIKILEVSDLYNSRLKSDALNFVKENFDELKNTREWIELKSKNATLALEVYSISE